MKHIQRYWMVYAIITAVIGILAKLYSGQYSLHEKVISTIGKDGQVTIERLFVPTINHPTMDIVSTILLTFSISLLIAVVFIRALDRLERQQFENFLVKVQQGTAVNAVTSVFNQMIDEGFVKIFNADILNADFIRKDAHWEYDISYTDRRMKLIRTITYHLCNPSQEYRREITYLAYLEDVHSNTTTNTLKYRLEGETEFTYINLDIEDENGVTSAKKQAIIVPPQKSAEVVIVLTQSFDRNYIYETQFTNKPIVNLSLTVNLPSEYDFAVNAGMLSSKLDQVVNEPTKKFYRANGAIYRGQGIEFVCAPKNSSEMVRETINTGSQAVVEEELVATE